MRPGWCRYRPQSHLAQVTPNPATRRKGRSAARIAKVIESPRQFALASTQADVGPPPRRAVNVLGRHPKFRSHLQGRPTRQVARPFQAQPMGVPGHQQLRSHRHRAPPSSRRGFPPRLGCISGMKTPTRASVQAVIVTRMNSLTQSIYTANPSQMVAAWADDQPLSSAASTIQRHSLV